jgi:predicted lipoprotein with Yx(FWY)xxD motif
MVLPNLLILGVLILSACQPAAVQTSLPTATSAPAPARAPSDTPAAQLPSEATISVFEDPKLGNILVGDNGMTLYMFTKDEANKSNCDAECLAKWPPLLTQGKPNLGEGVDAALIGAASLPDGSLIVTYNQIPLYDWVKDTQPGDTTGQGVGEVWYVVSVTGTPVMVQAVPPANNAPPEDKGGNY